MPGEGIDIAMRPAAVIEDPLAGCDLPERIGIAEQTVAGAVSMLLSMPLMTTPPNAAAMDRLSELLMQFTLPFC